MLEYIKLGVIIISCITILFFVYWITKNVKKAKSSVTDTSWRGVFEAVIKVLEKELIKKDIKETPAPDLIKREKITKRKLKSFYYLDILQIQYLLPQINKEDFLLTKVETNQVKDSKLGAKLPGGHLGTTQNVSTKEIYERQNDSVVKMYQEIEKHFFSANEIQFGVEDIFKIRINHGISLFKEKCKELKSFSYNISDEDQEKHIKYYGNKMAEETIQSLSKTTGFIAMEIDVELSEVTDEIYILTYAHPINEYLLDQSKGLSIKLLCIKSNLTTNGSTVLQKGRRFNITSLGKITGWDQSNMALEVTPISIY